MDATLVSARVARGKKEHGVEVLSSMGATVSDLINSAFDYVIAAKQLPIANEETARRTDEFAQFVERSTLDVNWPEGFDGNYKKLIAEGRLARYESLA